MQSWSQALFNSLLLSPYPALLLSVLLQSVVLFLAAATGCFLWRRAAAAAKHLLWFAALASLPCLLSLSFLPHSWSKSLWSVATDLDSGNQVSLSLTLTPSASAAQSLSPAATAKDLTGLSQQAPAANQPPLAARFDSSWLARGFLLWSGGALLGLVWVAAGQLPLRRLARQSVPLADPDWDQLSREACQTLGLGRRPTLLLGREDQMPLTWGWWRPVVLLPAEAQTWPTPQRRMVLLHELAHVKRRDCLTQTLAQVICALFWLNPLVWVAARRMRIERERACDDLVLQGGCKASDYATQLLEVASAFRPARYAAAIGMARPGQLQSRIAALVDSSRARQLSTWTAVGIVGAMIVLTGCLSGNSGKATVGGAQSAALRQQQLAQLEAFARAKEKQSEALAAKAGESIAPDFKAFFAAAAEGDIQTVTNRYEYFKQHHPQYRGGTNAVARLRTPYWQPVLEIAMVFDLVATCEPKYTQILTDGIINSIPAGGIYFGGTDPGRGVPTAFEKSSIEGDPFFCLTQNALADASYLEYVRAMYGDKIYTPSAEDSQKCFEEYLADATRRLEEHQLKPGESVRRVDNRVEVSGQVAVMSINALLTKLIFDHNPDRDFYVEESFPLDWMYPYLEPHGLILKLNRQPQPQLRAAVLEQDRAYWRPLMAQMVGQWLDEPTQVSEVTAFVHRVYGRKNLSGFTGDRRFIQNEAAQKLFSKLRSSIAGVYAWRLSPNAPAEFRPQTEAEKQQLIGEADLAFRQAYVLCPYSPEALFRYVNFLVQFNRREDALLLAQASLELDPKNRTVENLVQNLQQWKGR